MTLKNPSGSSYGLKLLTVMSAIVGFGGSKFRMDFTTSRNGISVTF
jgi:hypothetical protein